MVYDGRRRKIVLYGGYEEHLSYGSAFNDFWQFDGTNWSPVLTYTRSPINGSRYALTPPMSWAQAEALAVQEGGHLATIRNASEQAWVVQNLGPGDAWIGLTDAQSEGAWTWVSGEVSAYQIGRAHV